MQFEKDVELLDLGKPNDRPCEKMRDLLDKWSEQEIDSMDDLDRFAVSFEWLYFVESSLGDYRRI